MEAANGFESSNTLYRYRFGTAQFDESRQELQVGGRAIQLEHKSLQVLAVLLRRSGRVVTREELLASVWERRPAVYNVLSNAVMKLRRALGTGNLERIVTQRKLGYRLEGPVERFVIAPVHFDTPSQPWPSAADRSPYGGAQQEVPSAHVLQTHVLQTIESILAAARQVHGRSAIDSMLLEWTRSQLVELAREPVQVTEHPVVLGGSPD